MVKLSRFHWHQPEKEEEACFKCRTLYGPNLFPESGDSFISYIAAVSCHALLLSETGITETTTGFMEEFYNHYWLNCCMFVSITPMNVYLLTKVMQYGSSRSRSGLDLFPQTVVHS